MFASLGIHLPSKDYRRISCQPELHIITAFALTALSHPLTCPRYGKPRSRDYYPRIQTTIGIDRKQSLSKNKVVLPPYLILNLIPFVLRIAAVIYVSCFQAMF